MRLIRRSADSSLAESGLLVLALGLLGVLVLYPLGSLLQGSFLSQSPIRPGGELTTVEWQHVYTSPRYLGVIWNTLAIAIPVVVMSVLAGASLAYVNTRTNTPGVRIFEVGIFSTVLLSPLVGALSWMFVGSPNAGLVNVLTQNLFGVSVINVLSWPGVYFVMTLDFIPYVYLLTVAALRATDPSLEEAARMLGANLISTARRVTLPMMAPALLGAGLLVFVLAAESFSVPGTLGRAAGIINLPYAIYREINTIPANWPRAAILGTILLAFTLVALVLYQRVLRKSRRFVGVSGRSRKPAVVSIGRWRYLTAGANCLYLALAFVIPYSALLLSSLLRFPTSRLRPELFTLENYAFLTQPETLTAARNTVVTGLVAASLLVGIAYLVVLLSHRTRIRGRSAIDTVSMLPIAIPGSVFGIAMLWAYFRIPLPIYGTLFVLILAYWATYLPVAVRSVTGAVLQIDSSLEETGRVLGASRPAVWRLITIPLSKGAAAYAWLFVAVLIVREVSTAVILAGSSDTRLLSVLIWQSLDSGRTTRAAALGVAQTAIVVAGALAIFVAVRWIRRRRGPRDDERQIAPVDAGGVAG